ncbi:elongation factor 1-gamma [Hysterangium stoloniferum]|nr:elongation factor 1-gamma [Hysterangium stoloniferum]
MSSIGTITTADFPAAQRIFAVAALAGLKIDRAEGYTHFQDNKKPEFLAKFPTGLIPAFESKDGFCLVESSAIERYVASLAPNSGLLGSSLEESALIDQWVHFTNTEIMPISNQLHQMLRGVTPYFKPLETTIQEKRARHFGTLDKHLSTRTFFVGERITVADVHVASVMINTYKFTFGVEERAKFPHLTRHFETIINQPKLKPIFGEIPFPAKALQYVAPAKPKKEEKPKEVAAPKPKAEKPKPKAAEPEDEDDEDLVKEEPKAKNPLDLLPKSSFNLEDWKRAYSNMDTRGEGGSIKWFYEKFDKEGFSIWRVDFKYNNELTQTFMSSNQIGGFFNRLEASRKYLFGSVGVLGVANDSVISGVFITRGSDIKAAVDCAPDWESYEYTRLNPFTEGPEKTFFEGALAWDLEVDGKKWADGKNYK